LPIGKEQIIFVHETNQPLVEAFGYVASIQEKMRLIEDIGK